MGLSPKEKKKKAEINKWDLNKLKSFWKAKEAINKKKGPPTEWASERKVKVLVTQLCPNLCDPMGCSPQAPLSMGFSRQEYSSGSHSLLQGSNLGLPDPEIDQISHIAGRFFTIWALEWGQIFTKRNFKLGNFNHKQHVYKALQFTNFVSTYLIWLSQLILKF